MLRVRARVVVATVTLALVAPSLPSRLGAQAHAAPEDDQAKAAALKKKGDAAMDALQYSDALAAYTEAYALAKDPALLYNRGRALQMMGRFPEALVELERFRAEAPPELLAKVPKLDALIADVKGRVAHLAVTCNVAGAQVVVRDKVLGTTPFTGPVALVSGKATLVVSAEGHFPVKREVDLPGNQTTTLDVALSPKAKFGVLTVKTKVPGARVAIDGQPYGDAPAEATLPPGDHKVRVFREGYEDAEVNAVVVVGDRREVEVLLAEKAGITRKWWFWTGVGVVVVAGVVVGAALLTERKASSGDGFTPGQVSGPLFRF